VRAHARIVQLATASNAAPQLKYTSQPTDAEKDTRNSIRLTKQSSVVILKTQQSASMLNAVPPRPPKDLEAKKEQRDEVLNSWVHNRHESLFWAAAS
jgi:hypothetical protein